MRDGEFAHPRAIGVREISGAHEIFVIDKTGRVQVFGEDGVFLRKWLMPEWENGTPTAVCFSGETVIIPDTHYSQIAKYSPEGEVLGRWGSFGTGPEEFIYPTGVCRGPAGEYLFSEYGDGAHRVHLFDKDRHFLRQWGQLGPEPGNFSRPMAIGITEAGLVCVADTANHRVQCFSLEGELIRIIGEAGDAPGQLKYPHDLAIGPDGLIAVAEYGTHRISCFREDGAFLRSCGTPGRGPDQLNAPRGVAVASDGTLYVADTDNHRVRVFDGEGTA